MRRLLIFRHAHAEKSQPGGQDHARVLTERGRADAKLLGAYIDRHGFVPARALVSTAERARETWQHAASAMRAPPAADFEARIYDARPHDIVTLLKKAPAEAASLMLIGHNPTLHELAALLIASGDHELRERLREELPTAGLAVIEFAFDAWEKLHAHSGRLERFVSPKSIAAATN